jgi:hypothetical protein
MSVRRRRGAVNWDAVGALAELAGALGVILTLGYLAVQIRQNSKLLAASAADSSRDAYNELGRILGTSTDAARVYTIGMEDPASLSPEETTQFHSLCHLSVNAVHQRFRTGSDVVDDSKFVMAQAGYRHYWAHRSEAYPEDFRELVSQFIERCSPAA